jgi:hypothetical protein
MVTQAEQQEKQQLEQKESNGSITDAERTRLSELRQKG